METLRYAGSALLLALFTIGAIQNWWVFWSTVITKKTTASAVPFLVGLLGCGGVLLLPIDGSWKLAWLPLVLDWGSLPAHVDGLYLTIRSKGGDD